MRHSKIACRKALLSPAALLGFLLLANPGSAWSETDTWSATLERISTGVVSIRIDLVRAFDTERNVSSQATGFVVDAEQGLILTNRHVVTPGPVRAEALFLNQEEVALTPVYRDPVHDFGIFRFDPEALRYIEPAQLALRPDLAAVGMEIRVVGNDAGEQLSILSGTIARLDRRAPNYGYGNYTDFNTDYIQAASGVSGGSSGSPVLDIRGNVIALNAGASSTAASSFFLPLDRVRRAVDLIREGKPVTRGTIETQFVRAAYSELRRLGLQPATEEAFRRKFPAQTGMLIVSRVLPGGPADGAFKTGDILLEVNGKQIADFVPLEAILDDSVDQKVRFKLERNGAVIQHELAVTDLHSITPSEYIQFGDGVFHNLSYQQAWHLNKPVAGVYVAAPGYVLRSAGIPRQSVITEVDGLPITNLDEFEAAIAKLADGQNASVRYFTLYNPQSTNLAIMRMDRRWFPVTRCVRDDQIGEWPCRELAAGPPALTPMPATTEFVAEKDKRLSRIARSLVLVNFDMPYTISGVGDRNYYGTGVIVDAKRGYVVVDRNTVPEAMGDVRITFAGSVEVSGKVVFVHPLHNLTVLSYDPAMIGDTPVESARLGTVLPRPSDDLLAVGLRSDSRLVSQAVNVASVDPVVFDLSSTMQFRESNLEVISLVNPPSDFDGVLLDQEGTVAALWSSFSFEVNGESYQENKGVPADLVAETLELVADNRPLYSLEVELSHIPLSLARSYGLSDEWVARIEESDPEQRQLLTIVRTVAGTNSAEVLQAGDLLLAIDDQPVTRFREVEKAVQKSTVNVTVWRSNAVQSFTVATTVLDGLGVRRALMWNGSLLQAPYRQMAAQRGIEPYGVYVTFVAYGSPAARAELAPGSRIVEIDGVAVPDLDRFIELMSSRSQKDSVRLTTITWNDTTAVITLKPDSDYWPTWEVRYKDGWQRIPVNTASTQN